MKRPHRILRTQDAFAGMVFWGMFFLVYLSMGLDDWVRLHRLAINPMAFLATTSVFMASLNRFLRARRGEKLRDAMAYPQNASWGWVLLGSLGVLACVAGSLFVFLQGAPPHSFLMALGGAGLVGMGLIAAGLLGKWTWREYRRRRFGDSIEQLEIFSKPTGEEQAKLRYEGVGGIGMGLAGLFLLILGILASGTVGLATAVLGGMFFLGSLGAIVGMRQKPDPPEFSDPMAE